MEEGRETNFWLELRVFMWNSMRLVDETAETARRGVPWDGLLRHLTSVAHSHSFHFR